jgi:uncharacterized protein HemY
VNSWKSARNKYALTLAGTARQQRGNSNSADNKLREQAKRPMDKKLREQAKRPMDKKLREQAKRPMDKKLREQAKRPMDKKLAAKTHTAMHSFALVHLCGLRSALE